MSRSDVVASPAVTATVSPVPTGPDGGPTDALAKLRAGQLTALWLRKKVDVGVGLLRTVGPILPQPGPSAAELLATVLEHCSKALANQDKMAHLAERCTDLLGLLVQHVEPPAAGPVPSKKSFGAFTERFRKELQDVLNLCYQYADTQCCLRVINSSEDLKKYEKVVKNLKELKADVVLECTVITRQMVEKKVVPALEVLDDKAEMLDGKVETLIATVNDGYHTLIAQLEMKAFWCEYSKGQDQMRWRVWWYYFPVRMNKWLADGDYKKLCDLLRTEEAKSRFQAAMEDDDPTHIGVDEVMKRFPKRAMVVDRVQQLLNGAAGPSSNAEDATAAPATPAAAAATAADAASNSAVPPAVQAGNQRTAKCDLPALDPMYNGRKADAGKVRSWLTSEVNPARSVLLLAGCGLGKSSLAVDVGWQLWHEGLLPGGAAMANLRGAATQAQQLQRICAALGVPYDDEAVPRLLAKLGSLPADHHLLLVLDNAEDCLGVASAATFTQLVAKVLRSSPAVRLLITSQVPWPTASSPRPSMDPSSEPLCADAAEALPDYQEYPVPPLGEAARAELLRTMCPEDVLPPAQLKPVLKACGGSPLLTRLVADALSHGRLAPEAVIEFAEDSSAVQQV